MDLIDRSFFPLRCIVRLQKVRSNFEDEAKKMYFCRLSLLVPPPPPAAEAAAVEAGVNK